MASVVNAPNPDAYEMPKAMGALRQAREAIERDREVWFWDGSMAVPPRQDSVDRNGKRFLEFNHRGLLDESATVSEPFASWSEAVILWQSHLEAALGDAVAIEWRVVPEIACEAGKWVIYSRLSWDMGKPAPELSDQDKANALLAEAVKRIEARFPVGKVMNPTKAKTYDVTQTGFNGVRDPHLKPKKTAADAVRYWETYVHNAVVHGSGVGCAKGFGIDWKIKPEIAPSGDGWAVYARVAVTDAANIYTGKVQATADSPVIDELENWLLHAREGGIRGMGVVVVFDDGTTERSITVATGYYNDLIAGTFSLLCELNEDGNKAK